jgi:hypothetical protein
MEVENMNVVKLDGLEIIVKIIGYFRGNPPIRIAMGKVDKLRDRETTHAISQNGHTDIGNALDYPIVNLSSGSQRPCRIVDNIYPAAGASLYFLYPLLSQNRVQMRRREKITVA